MRSLSQAKRSGTQPAGMEALVDREGQAYERRKRVVLVVEDDRPIGELLASIINDEDGYVAIHVTRPRDALQVLTKVRPDLLVLDVGLPEMSGIELYDKVHADERFERVPVIFETAVADRHRSEFRQRGIDTIVEKPFDINDVVRQVRQLAPPPRLH